MPRWPSRAAPRRLTVPLVSTVSKRMRQWCSPSARVGVAFARGSGAPGRNAGYLIEPPDATGVKHTRIELALSGRRDLAKVFATEWSDEAGRQSGRQLYLVLVEPSDLEDDPDMASLGVSFAVPRARVEKVWEVDVKSTTGLSRKDPRWGTRGSWSKQSFAGGTRRPGSGRS